MTTNEAFVTLSTNDTYCLGALVLGHSLRGVNTRVQLVIMIGTDVSQEMKVILRDVFDEVYEVNIINCKDQKLLSLMNRPELGTALTKLHCWTLTKYSKCVFMDADTLVMKNIDELFEREELSAVCDIGWPDCFDAGVFVFKPSEKTFHELITFLDEKGSFDGADQGLLNAYFSDWAYKDISKQLSIIYNMALDFVFSYFPAYNKFGANVKVVNFLGAIKPWMYDCDIIKGEFTIPEASEDHIAMEYLWHWWSIFNSKVLLSLSEDYIVSFDRSRRKYLEKQLRIGNRGLFGLLKFEKCTDEQRKVNLANAKPNYF